NSLPIPKTPEDKVINSEVYKTFKNWDKPIEAVINDTDYIAHFETIVKEYKITFYDEDGKTILEQFSLTKGILPNPTNPNDIIVNEAITKVFKGWDKTILSATEDINYYAIYEIVIKSYNIKWQIDDNNIVIEKYQYDEEIDIYIPVKPGHKFIGWDQDIPKNMPSNDLVFNAIFEKEQYLVSFLNEDGVLIEELLVNYKDKIAPIIVEERNGYFYSWLKDGIPYNFNQEIKSNITLKLTWFEEVDSYNLDIYYLNDTHGAVLKKDEELGLSYIGNYIKEQYKNNPLGSLFIAGGDMFQGQLISNDNKGALMVEIFNELNLDAFVIGNHEFDWGLETILKYFDPSETGIKANFPILGANVVEKATNARPDFIDSHVIIKRRGLKIGIIGVIGDNLESSIATLRVKDYYFSNAYQAVVTTANEIKNDVDIILVVNHHNDQNFNNRVSSIDKVSAVFNGHTHSTYTGLLNNKIPYIQSGSNGKYVGNVKLEFDKYKNLTNGIAINIKNHNDLNSYDYIIEALINQYYNNIKHLYEEEILTASYYLSTTDLANYIAKIMKKVTGAVAGFQNSGGTRATISNGQKITAADIFQVFPFDNQIIYTDVTGSQLKKLLDDSYLYSNSNISYSDIKNNEIYRVATNDYIFYSSYQSYAFKDKEGILYGDMYETFYQILLNLKENGYTHFDTNSPIIIN
ncbi:MAG TPA: bifunctional metallophosphatase/5'-nucleotidase, partial [Acholeplasma sp.]|nr:bifunctional metallophosphatase/5'-nucleotidase [Acholeplasma sp.]